MSIQRRPCRSSTRWSRRTSTSTCSTFLARTTAWEFWLTNITAMTTSSTTCLAWSLRTGTKSPCLLTTPRKTEGLDELQRQTELREDRMGRAYDADRSACADAVPAGAWALHRNRYQTGQSHRSHIGRGCAR